MYFRLVHSPQFFVAAFGRKSMRKIFWDAPEFMELIYHEFVGNPAPPPYTSLSCHFQMDISFVMGKRPIGVN